MGEVPGEYSSQCTYETRNFDRWRRSESTSVKSGFNISHLYDLRGAPMDSITATKLSKRHCVCPTLGLRLSVQFSLALSYEDV
jgi:hypothetical protein